MILDLIKPYAHFLAGFPLIVHYVMRTCQVIEASDNQIELKFVLDTLSSVFTSEFLLAQEDTGRLYLPFPVDSLEVSLLHPKKSTLPLSQGGAGPPWGIHYFLGVGHTSMISQTVNWKALDPNRCVWKISKDPSPGLWEEIATREATLGGSLGTTVHAIDTDLPQTRIPTPPSIPKRPSSFPVCKSPSLEVRQISQIGESKKVLLPQTGREVVEEFVKGNFLGEFKFAFLNSAPSVRYNPYNLVVVPEEEVNPEHYVISSNCVLHVNPHGPSETQSLAEWYREMCLFKAISSIGFFRNFLVTKNVQKMERHKEIKPFSLELRQKLRDLCLQMSPVLGLHCLESHTSCKIWEKVTFLPFQVNFSYPLDEFGETSS